MGESYVGQGAVFLLYFQTKKSAKINARKKHKDRGEYLILAVQKRRKKLDKRLLNIKHGDVSFVSMIYVQKLLSPFI